ncbi:MAG: carbamate kinase [Mycoplasmataceae bacterium]|nr:carbamate kinase [Mycoplasmataceae bacterium]
MKKIVLALGGNALGNTPSEQQEAVKITSKSIVDLVEQGNKVLIVHGNGPQVGMIYNAFDEASKINNKIPKLSLALSGAMSQGYIGLHLQQAILNELKNRKMNQKVASIITQTMVNSDDLAFKNPIKPIGTFMTEKDAKKISDLTGAFVGEDSGRGWRIMVPSPKPIFIYEKDIILDLVKKEYIVIAGGGGGIPTLETNSKIKEIDAVIDKDFTASKIAELIDADLFMIVTAEDGIWKNYGKENSYQLVNPSVDEIQSLVDKGEFPEGSMKPKVQAIINFLNSNSDKKNVRKACITSLEKAADALKGNAGTWIKK